MHACLRRFINCAQIPIQSKTLQGVDTAIKPSIWDWGTLLFFQVLLVLWPATFMRFACTVGTILHQLRHTSSLWPCKVPKPRRRFRTTHLNSQSWDMATHRVLFFARTNRNQHSSWRLSTSAEHSAEVEAAYVPGKADNDAVCSSTSFCACTSKFSAQNQWPYSLVYLAPWLYSDFSLRYRRSAAQTSRFHQLTSHRDRQW